MTQGSTRYGRSIASVLLALAMVVAVLPAPALAVPVPQDPALTESQQQLSAVMAKRQQVLAQLSRLEPEVELATEEYNNAVEQLSRTREQFEFASTELMTAEQNLAGQRTAFNSRLVALYRSGEYGAIDLLLSVSSVSELITHLDFMIAMGDRDASVLKGMAEEQQKAEGARDQLAALQQQQVVLELQAAQKKHDAEKKQAELTALMGQLDEEFRQLLAQQSEAQQAQQAEMLAAVKANSGSYGIVIEPGSPVETALQYLGIPYVWGGDDPVNGFDCSGLLMYVMRQHGVELPHYSRAQAEMGIPVTYDTLMPGDFVFFGSPIHHVGMYIGGGYYVHAPKTGDVVKISKLADRGDFATARRYAWVYKQVPGAPTSPTGGTSGTGSGE